MTTKEEVQHAGRPGGGRIVVGVDGSPGSLAALRWALSEASLRGVVVHTVGIWNYTGGRGFNVSAGDPRPRDEMVRAMETTIAAALTPTSGYSGVPSNGDHHARPRRPNVGTLGRRPGR